MTNFKCWREIRNREQIDREICDWEQIDREIRDWEILSNVASTVKFAIGSNLNRPRNSRLGDTDKYRIDREIRNWEQLETDREIRD